MRPVDRVLQARRIAQARPYIMRGTRVLDIGCADGALFRQLESIIESGVGIDPDLDRPLQTRRWTLVRGWFPKDCSGFGTFDVITMLAVLEHVQSELHPVVASACADLLRPGGRLIVTVPSRLVDPLLGMLKSLHLIEGMALEQHHGFDPRNTVDIFVTGGLLFIKRHRFQLGLNNLFVFTKDMTV
jgi:2-polyprenyl-3-methyl-5-hydroxy-6-metoxy-1,4-benzoquinol methylase